MSDRGPYDQGDEGLPPPPGPADRDDVWRATRPSVYPDDPGFAGFREPDPTQLMPIVGAELGEPGEDRPPPWYRQPGVLAALIAGGFALLVAAIAVFALDDDDGDASLVEATPPSTSSTSTSSTSTTSTTSTTVVLVPALPPASSAAPTTTSTTAPPTTLPTTTAAPPTTAPSTTTTTAAPTTTVASATTTSSSTTTTVRPTTTTARPTTTTDRPTTTGRPTTTAGPPTSIASTTSGPSTTVDPSRPTTTTTPRATSTTTSSIPRQASAWDYIVRSRVLRELERYIRRADMIDVFDRPGITVLAPIDQSFDDLLVNPGGQELLEDPVRLRALLERHVVDERLTEREIFERTELETIGGALLPVDPVAATIEGGQIVDGDQATANGSVLHVFDPVLVADLIPT